MPTQTYKYAILHACFYGGIPALISMFFQFQMEMTFPGEAVAMNGDPPIDRQCPFKLLNHMTHYRSVSLQDLFAENATDKHTWLLRTQHLQQYQPSTGICGIVIQYFTTLGLVLMAYSLIWPLTSSTEWDHPYTTWRPPCSEEWDIFKVGGNKAFIFLNLSLACSKDGGSPKPLWLASSSGLSVGTPEVLRHWILQIRPWEASGPKTGNPCPSSRGSPCCWLVLPSTPGQTLGWHEAHSWRKNYFYVKN